MGLFDPVSLALFLALLAFVPLAVIMTTSFLKIVVVMMLVRNALGVQQIPPNMALYALALLLSIYVMAPVGLRSYEVMEDVSGGKQGTQMLLKGIAAAAEPLREFMVRNSDPQQQEFFLKTTERLWPTELANEMQVSHFIILVPAFIVSELTAAFKMGLLLYLPFVIIDLVVSNILLALGMLMVSPATISLPLKLFLFVMVEGWSRLIHGLVFSYI